MNKKQDFALSTRTRTRTVQRNVKQKEIISFSIAMDTTKKQNKK